MLGPLKNRMQPAGTPPGLLLHIGAGRGDDLPDYLEAGFEQIVLVEANPDLEPLLQGKLAAQPGARLISAAVTGADEADMAQVPLNILNYPELNSIRTPERLHALLPGIRVKDQYQVKALSVAELFETIPAPAPDQVNWLVLETPGSELAILEAMQACGDLLQGFTHVTLRCDAEPYFAGGTSAPALLDWMQARFFKLEERSDDDPDWPVLWFSRDDVALQNAALSARAQELEQALGTAQAEAEARGAALEAEQTRANGLEQSLAERQTALDDTEAARAEASALCETLRAELGEARSTATDAAEALRAELEAEQARAKALEESLAERQTALDDTEAARSEASALCETLRAERDETAEREKALQSTLEETQNAARGQTNTLRLDLAAERTRSGALDDRLATREARLQEVEAAHAEASQVAETLRAELDAAADREAALKTRLEEAGSEAAAEAEALRTELGAAVEAEQARTAELEEALAERQAQLDEAEAGRAEEMRMSMRLQSLAQLDKVELQDRYNQLRKDHAAQSDLLQQLTLKLNSAAGFLRQLPTLEADIANRIGGGAKDSDSEQSQGGSE